jgi:acyl-CoA synthetase (AMP-forming)/AMP-acid ligase II
MEKRWYKVWPPWIPKGLEVEKPTSEYLRDWASLTPERVALSFYGKDITYREVNERVDQLAWALLSLGLKKGDRIALYMENCPQFVISYFAIHRAGGVVVPLNPMFKHAELEYEIKDAQTETLITLDYLYPEVEKIKGQVQLKNVILTSLMDYLPDNPILPLPSEAKEMKYSYSGTLNFVDLVNKFPSKPVCHVTDLNKELALLLYTGGTTGLPKGAMISHYTLAVANIGSALWYHHREEDVHLGVTPFFHTMGQQQLMCAPLVSGGKVVILSRFVPDVVAKAIAYYRCTFMVVPTTALIALLSLPDIKQYDFSSFRCIWSGGAPISVEIQKRVKELAPKAIIGEGYGLTECVSQGGVITPLYRYKPGFIGVPHISDIRIVDLETGRIELPPNEEGEIIIKGPAVMEGYWNRPEETKEVLRDGWLHTGDIGLMDEEGYIKFLGRKRELIKCSGYSVFPSEVENLLYRHPAISEVAVIGVPDPYRGESPKAFIILKTEYQGKVREEEIIEWCKENMAAYKRPRVVEFREELPKSGAGKILRRVLAAEEEKRSEGSERKEKT